MSRARNWQRARERDKARATRNPGLPTAQPPTARQLRYLKVLAAGRPYTAPRTRWDASEQIDRFKQ